MGLEINFLGHLRVMSISNCCWNWMIFCLEQVDFLQYVCINFLVIFLNVLGICFWFSTRRPKKCFCTATCSLARWIVPGTLLSRKLTRLPKRRCWFVGYSEEDSLDIALKFNDTWETDWRMGIHDCRNYANGLVECLTGEKLVLERLRRRTAWLI